MANLGNERVIADSMYTAKVEEVKGALKDVSLLAIHRELDIPLSSLMLMRDGGIANMSAIRVEAVLKHVREQKSLVLTDSDNHNSYASG